MNRPELPLVLRRHPLVAVLRARAAGAYRPVVDALVDGGVRAIELTLTTPGTLEELPELRAALPADVSLGVGTVMFPDQARAAVQCGADFLVTPSFSPDLAAVVPLLGVPVIPGGLTPSELQAGWMAGAAAVKLFPASAVDPDYLRQLHGPFPGLPVVPSGGIDAAGAVSWKRAGAVAVSIGGPLLQDAFAGGDLRALARRAGELLRDLAAVSDGAAG